MKVKTILRRPLALALSLLLCAVCLTPEAAAVRTPNTIDGFDSSRRCSLTVNYPHTDKAVTLPNAYLYRVASVDANLNFVPVGGFAAVEGLADDLTAAKRTGGWPELVNKFLGIAESGRANGTIRPITQQVSRSGTATFTVEPGLYLATGDVYLCTENNNDGTTTTVTCTPDPYFVCLPTYNDSTQEWVYSDVASTTKVETDTKAEIDIHVVKVWDDRNDRRGLRPESVTVALMRGGVIVERATLHSGNNWRHDWTGLDNTGSGQWEVTELSVPSGYRFNITKTGTSIGYTFTVENYIPTPTTPGGGGGDPGGGDPPEDPDIPLEDPEVPKSDPPEEPPPPDDEVEILDEDVPLADLPQTGQLWWPVPFLAVGGMFFLLIGAVRRRRDEYEE